MFCNECGSKLSAADKVCRTCGTPADQGEACGGFWGLTGLEPPMVVNPPAEAPKKEEKPVVVHEPAAPKSAKKKSPVRLWQVISAVLLVVLLIQTIRIGLLNDKVDYYRDSLYDLRQEMWENRDQTGESGETEPPATVAPEETTEPEQTDAPTDETEVPDETEIPAETEVPDATDVPDETIDVDAAVEDALENALDSIFGGQPEATDETVAEDDGSKASEDSQEKP